LQYVHNITRIVLVFRMI